MNYYADWLKKVCSADWDWVSLVSLFALLLVASCGWLALVPLGILLCLCCLDAQLVLMLLLFWMMWPVSWPPLMVSLAFR